MEQQRTHGPAWRTVLSGGADHTCTRVNVNQGGGCRNSTRNVSHESSVRRGNVSGHESTSDRGGV